MPTRKLTPGHVVYARIAYRDGATAATIARTLGVSRRLIQATLAGQYMGRLADSEGVGGFRPGAAHGERSNTAKLTDEIVREIRASTAAGAKQVDLCHEYNITACPMSYLVRRKTWKNVAD